MKMQTDDWPDPRSISSFQTFPRANKPVAAVSNGYLHMNGGKSSLSREYDLIPGSKTNSLSSRSSSLCNDPSQYKFLEVKVDLGQGDRRFGFSVIGGSDEGFSPCLDEISAGSPADRADLEVGDEILEVNGKSLENATHTEVISHIHQCIRSRTICLRVKRKTGNKLALDLAHNSNVQDAFVIAVEQQARERLEKLSALKKIKPVDMTKLSQQFSQDSSTNVHVTQELNGIIESHPIYVTSVPELSNNSTEAESGIATTKFGGSDDDETHVQSQGGRLTDEEIELKQEIVEPVKSVVTSGLHRKASSKEMDVNIISRVQGDPFITRNDEGTDMSATHVTPPSSHEANGPHREMAVDVPDSFIGASKTPPRYPPPKTRTSGEHRRIGVPVLPPHANGSLPKPVLPPKEHSRAHRDLLESTPPLPPARGEQVTAKRPTPGPKPIPTPVAPSPTIPVTESTPAPMMLQEDQLERIRKYQEDIRKRREEEERIAREQEFLRTSLRGSKKLQALEQNAPPSTGIVNSAFELDDGDDDATERSQSRASGQKASHPLQKLAGPSELLNSLQRLETHLCSNESQLEEDLSALSSLLCEPEFQKALAVHNKVQEVWCFETPPTPVCADAQDLVQEVLNSLHECSLPEATELVDLLNKFELEGLIYAHDKIAENEALPAMTADEELLDRASQYTEDSIKIVRIDKTNEPLGATVRNEGESVIIGRIVKGGAAEKSGLIHEGDEVLEVNGIEMRGKSVNDVCDILANMTGTLTFLVIPTQDERPKQLSRDVVMHVKAHFDYDPEDDLYIPCRELGISFQKGDILHVINQEDPNWWQAYREGEEDQTLAGLIPSKAFQQQREAMKQTIVGGETNNKEKAKKSSKFLCAKKHPKKKKKKMLYNASINDDLDVDEILTYEEVALYYPRANRKRPIVLIGPPNIGRHELRQKLMEDVDRFAAAVPHTSRPKKDGELDGQDYYFISRPQFEADIVSRKFVEHGEYEKNYYGTSLDAIRTVVNSGKICVLNLHPQSLKILKASDLKPFVVFVAPPSLEKLRQNRSKMNSNIKDEELKEIIEKAREMEDNYGHYFDMVIINIDLERAYNQLLQEINILEREPQWVPNSWLKTEIN